MDFMDILISNPLSTGYITVLCFYLHDIFLCMDYVNLISKQLNSVFFNFAN